jgi:hypothetical protein
MREGKGPNNELIECLWFDGLVEETSSCMRFQGAIRLGYHRNVVLIDDL